MKIYLVGGAVRDQLLGLPVKERDWVVVGGTPEEMLQQGYVPVGKDFPVFIHPVTKEEYALARTERKTGSGYTGFDCYFAPQVSLEEDLLRRDLTINAMAKTGSGELIDPYGGQEDLQKRILRHVSPAFIEDPLRVLRVARFAARYASQGFQIAPETNQLMREMAKAGELSFLVPERVWLETKKALSEVKPSIFFMSLQNCGALKILFPEIEKLFGVPNPAQWHPEIDSGLHTMMVLDQAAKLSQDISIRFSALVHDLGKALTPRSEWPAHHGHEEKGVECVKHLCERLRVSTEVKELAVLTTRYHGYAHKVESLNPGTLLKLLLNLDVLRRPDRFNQFLLACEADSKGRTGYEEAPYPQANYLAKAAEVIRGVDLAPLVDQGYVAKALVEKIRTVRLDALTAWMKSKEKPHQ